MDTTSTETRSSHPYHSSFWSGLKELSASNTSSIYRSLLYSNTSPSASVSEQPCTNQQQGKEEGEEEVRGNQEGRWEFETECLTTVSTPWGSNTIVTSDLVTMTKTTVTSTRPHHRHAHPEFALVKTVEELRFELVLEQSRKVSTALHFVYRMRIEQRLSWDLIMKRWVDV